MTTIIETRPAEPVGRPLPVSPGTGYGLAVQEWTDGQTTWWQIDLSGLTTDKQKQAEQHHQALLSIRYQTRALAETAANQVRTTIGQDNPDNYRQDETWWYPPDGQHHKQSEYAPDHYQPEPEPAANCSGQVMNLYVHSQDCNDLNCPGQGA